MSFLKKLFSADPEALEKKADALYAAGDYGPAKLAYDKARAASPEDAGAALAEKVRLCTDGIARHRIEEAQAYLEQGSIELAEQELEGPARRARSQGRPRAGRSARDDRRRAHRVADGSVGGSSSRRVRGLW